MQKAVALIFISFLMFTCKSKSSEDTSKDALFELMTSEQTGINFVNQLKEDEKLNIVTFEYFYNGGGVALGDINNDGLVDVFLGGNMVNSRLYLNRSEKGKSDLKFEDITQKSSIKTDDGWATGIAMVDINEDGWLDIYVCRAGPHKAAKRTNQLYINQGNSTFKEQAQQYGLADTTHTTQAAFFDYDKDGDLDVYLLTNVIEKIGPNIIHPKITDGTAQSTDRLYRNNGKNTLGQITFTNVSKQAGIQIEGYGLGVSMVDINQDGWTDVYVSNDYLSNDHLYINQKNGTFVDEVSAYFRHQSYSAMGNDAADIDNDGLVDFVTVDMLPEDPARRKNMSGLMNYERHLSELRHGYFPQYMRNTLQHNNGINPETGKNTFSEIGRMAGIHRTDWSWSALLADYDNDGFRDLMITNGFPKDITNRDFVAYRMGQYQKGNANNIDLLKTLNTIQGATLTNYLYQNNAGNLTFTNQTKRWGFNKASFSNGAAYADLDNDGDLDLVINNIDQEAFVYRNRTNQITRNHFLRVQLKGEKTNPFGYGTKVEVYYSGKKQAIEHSPYRGYLSTVENTLHFGLGKIQKIDSLSITWPNQKVQVLRGIQTDTVLKISINEAVYKHKKQLKKAETLFTEASQKLNIHYKHIDELYIDFKIQTLLPHLLSQNGPGISVGDVNGDNREDFFVGGAFNHSGALFFQSPNNTFIKKELVATEKYQEDLGTLLFDADSDGDLDLYIVSGSNEFEANSKYLGDRLYKNDGKGNFTLDSNALPNILSSGSTVNAADFDRDGDLDLFVGGYLSAGQYPMPTSSYILENNAGKFRDISQSVCPKLKDIGMVKSGLWTDFDQDGWVDLLLIGEWMPITFLKNEKGKLKDFSASTGLKHTNGWWDSLVAGDFDKDGDIDYISGNLGLNNEWKTSPEKPLTIFAKDFDQNGIIDPVIAQYEGETLYPVHPRDEMTSQMSYLRKKLTSYAAYADASMAKLFTEEEMAKAYQAKCETFQSIYLENLGKGQFKAKPLPILAQTAPIYGMNVQDFDGDSNLDVLLIGNSLSTESTTGRYDAFNGLLLKGNGRGVFAPISIDKSGFYVAGDGKGMANLILSNNQILILSAQNNDLLKAHLHHQQKSVKYFKPNAIDSYAIITSANGKMHRHEFQYGSSYLSQSSRMLSLPKNYTKMQVYDFAGNSRVVDMK